MTYEVTLQTAGELMAWGEQLGASLVGGEVIELVGDIGAGKTTLTKGIACGMGIDESVQSPTFTLSRVYNAPNGLRLAHYDFYRLNDAGIMQAELDEATNDPHTVTVIEWAAVVGDVLPADTLRISIATQADNSRILTMTSSGDQGNALIAGVKQ